MAFAAKLTYFFNAQKIGWSEIWYKTVDNLDEAMASALAIAQPRANLLGKGSVIEAIKVSDETISGDSKLDATEWKQAKAGVVADLRDTPWNAWLIRAAAGTFYRRAQWFRGIPDDWLQIDATTFTQKKPPDFVAAFNSWRDQAIKQKLQLRALAKEDAVAPAKVITKLEIEAGVWKITAPNHGFAALQPIRIKGVKGDNVDDVNGVWQIFSPTADTFLIPETAPLTPFLYKGGGVARKREVRYYDITEFQYLRAGKRNTGRAFFVPLGRRRRR